jgi:hypothetical protein
MRYAAITGATVVCLGLFVLAGLVVRWMSTSAPARTSHVLLAVAVVAGALPAIVFALYTVVR